jgi:hypothetical protein
VRLLKTDKSRDVVQFVEDIQTFPMNEEGKEVNLTEFLQRVALLSNSGKNGGISDTS